MPAIQLSACSVDLDTGEVRGPGRQERLTTKELALLSYLVARPGEDVTRASLLTEVWGYSKNAKTRAVSDTLKRLRRKVERDRRAPDHFHTVYGVGFRYVPAAPQRRPRAPRTSLVGRTAELDRLVALTQASPGLVTLRGPAGVGKTRLSKELLARSSSDAPHFIDLRSAEDAAALVPAILQALEVQVPGGNVDLVAHASRALSRHHHPLLVLDNLEHLPGAAAFISALLDQCPELRLVATSRASVGVVGEQVVDLKPLSQDAAMALFVARARSRRPDFAPSEADLTIIADCVDRMDRLPLAIEMAAARIELFSPTELRARLGGSLDLLRRDRSDVLAPWGSVREAIAWSWALLAPEERAALTQLSLLRGDFDLAMAEAIVVVDVERPVLDVLASLRDQSLLTEHRSDAGGRVFGLLQSVREYARRFLPEAPWTPLHDRYAGRCAQIAEKGTTDERRLALADLWHIAGHALDHGPPDTAAWAVGTLVGVVNRWGRYTDFEALTRRALTLPLSTPMRLEVTEALCWLLSYVGRGAEAYALADTMVPLAEALDAPRWRAAVPKLKTQALRNTGQVREALPYALDALAQYRTLGLRGYEGYVLCILSTIYTHLQQHDDAEHAARQSLALAMEAGGELAIASRWMHLAQAHAERGHHEEARLAFAEALRLGADHNGTRIITLIGLGRVHTDLGDVHTAAELLERAYGEAERIGALHHTVRARSLLAHVSVQLGDVAAGLTEHMRCMAEAHQISPRAVRRCTLHHIESLVFLGRHDQARAELSTLSSQTDQPRIERLFTQIQAAAD